MRTATLLLLLVVSSVTIRTQDAPRRIEPTEAKKFRGQLVTVCGTVVNAACREPEHVTVFRFAPWPAYPLTVTIPAAKRSDPRMEDTFLLQNACVTGVVRKGKNGDEINLDDAAHLVREGSSPLPPFGADAHWSCEAGVTMPKKILNVNPVYPPTALKNLVSGSVFIETVIGRSGIPGEMRLISSAGTELDQEGLRIVKQWRYQPGLFNGEPAAVILIIEVAFRITS